MIKLVIFDFDGVFTVKSLRFRRKCMKHYHAKVGFGIGAT